MDLITSKSDDQTFLFPLNALAEHFNQVTVETYRQEVLNRVEKNLLISDVANRLSSLSENLHLDPRALEFELEAFAKHLNAINCLDIRFRSYINEAIKSVKEILFHKNEDEYFSDLIPIFLQFVALDEEGGMNINDYKMSFWLDAPAELINPLLDIWIEYLEPQNQSEVMDSLFILTTLEKLNPQIKLHLMAKT